MSLRKITCIGVGRMGGGIARNLLAASTFDVTVFDLNTDNVKALADAGAVPAGDMHTAVREADLVITSLPTPEILEPAIMETLEDSPDQALWMDVSTIDPTTASRLEKAVTDSGRRFIACPLGKGPAQADEGSLPLFVGCERDLLDALSEVFAAIGDHVHYMGSPAAAAAFKTVSNMVGMANLAVLAEGYTLCQKLGVEDEAFAQALRDTGGWSAQADTRLGWMMDSDFDNRFAIDLAIKDVRLAIDAAARAHVPTPVGAAGLMQLVAASRQGFGSEDVDAVLKVVADK